MDIGRKQLPHETPLGIPVEEATFFVTFCAEPRGSDTLARHADAILEAVRHRNDSAIWYCRIFLVMPDHAHALLRFPDPVRAGLVGEPERWPHVFIAHDALG